MSSRWRVVRQGDYVWCPGEHWWQAQNLEDDGEWYSDPNGVFSHWHDALSYADQKAHEVTVTLPSVGQVTKVHGTTIITTTTGIVIHGYARAGYRLQEVFVPHERAEDVALALLAHVRKRTA